MKHCFMIMAHTQPKLLECLLKQIDFECNTIIIHIDKKKSIKDFITSFNVVKHAKLIILKKRKKCFWGTLSLVKVEYLLFKEALKHDFEYCHLLSGQTLLIKSFKELNDFIEINKNKQFIDINEENCDLEIRHKIGFFHLFKNKFPFEKGYKFNRKLRSKSISIQNRLHINRIKDLKNFKKGSQWFSSNKKFLEYVVLNKRKILKRYKYTSCADEIFIPTLYYNSNFYNENNYGLTYTDWSEHKFSPKTLEICDFDKIKNSNKFFARKFSLEHIDLVNKILES